MHRFSVLLILLYYQTLCLSVTEEEINECLDKVEHDFNDCGSNVSQQWKCILGMSESEMHCNSDEKQCCAMWDLFDCFTDVIGRQCGQHIADNVNQQQFEHQIRTEENERCPQLKYHSTECQTLRSEVESQSTEGTTSDSPDDIKHYTDKVDDSDNDNQEPVKVLPGEGGVTDGQDGQRPDVGGQDDQSVSDKPRFRSPKSKGKPKEKQDSRKEYSKPSLETRSINMSKVDKNYGNRNEVSHWIGFVVALSLCSLYFCCF